MRIRTPRKTPRGKRDKDARSRLLQAAMQIIREKGYHATSVDDLCKATGLTKGAFFHHFPSKEALGVAAVEYWAETTSALFAAAPYHQAADPLERVLAYIDFRAALIQGPIEAFTCLAGTMVQEAYGKSDAIRQACDLCINDHASTLEADIAAAMEKYGAPAGVTAESLARHTQAVLQGGFILAKAGGGPEPAREAVAHLHNYIRLLFNQPSGSITCKERGFYELF